MNGIPFLKSFAIFTLLLSPTLSGFSPASPISPNPSNFSEISLNFPPTGNRGAPQKTTGGGTRSDDTSCISEAEKEPPLVALMPNRDNQGKTATSTPTLYWYIPTNTATGGEFVLLDEDGSEVYYTKLNLPKQPGIIKLQVPTQASLREGQKYTWSFMMICDSRYRNRDKHVDGVMEYVKPSQDLESQIKNVSLLDKAKLYAQATLWHETLDTLAQTRNKYPTEWQELLRSVGLESFANVPFIDCCQTSN